MNYTICFHHENIGVILGNQIEIFLTLLLAMNVD